MQSLAIALTLHARSGGASGKRQGLETHTARHAPMSPFWGYTPRVGSKFYWAWPLGWMRDAFSSVSTDERKTRTVPSMLIPSKTPFSNHL